MNQKKHSQLYFFLAFILWMIPAQFCRAQNYIPFPLEEGTQWREVYLCVESLNPSCIEFFLQDYTISGDTNINGVAYKKIYNVANPFMLDWDTPNCCERGTYMMIYFNGNKMAIRQDTALRKVYMYSYDSNSEELLYDFSINVNDTLFSELACEYDPCYMQYDIVQSIDSILIDSLYHRRWNFSCIAPIIEGVGSIDDFPGSLGWYGTLVCLKTLNYTYRNYGIFNFDSTQVDYSCSFIASDESIIPIDDKISTYPNPVDDRLEIRFDNSGIEEWEIVVYNTSGQKILSEFPGRLHTGTTIEIDVQTLPAGFYWIDVKAGEKIFRDKFLKR